MDSLNNKQLRGATDGRAVYLLAVRQVHGRFFLKRRRYTEAKYARKEEAAWKGTWLAHYNDVILK